MNQWNEQYAQATKALTLAHAADQAAYDAIASESKAFWAVRTVDTWPHLDSYRPWHDARVALLATEKTVVEVLRWRCAAIRLGLPMNSIAPKHADLVASAHMDHRADTVPAELTKDGYLRRPSPSFDSLKDQRQSIANLGK